MKSKPRRRDVTLAVLPNQPGLTERIKHLVLGEQPSQELPHPGPAGGMRVTRSFAEYVTSDAILIGAEVDKIVSIGAVTALLAIAVMRARNLLIRATTEAHAGSELSRFLLPKWRARSDMRTSGSVPAMPFDAGCSHGGGSA